MDRKLRLNSALTYLFEATSIFAYLDAHHAQLLEALGADAIAVCEQNGVIAVYGDESVAPTAWGVHELNKLCSDNKLMAVSSFTAGLQGEYSR